MEKVTPRTLSGFMELLPEEQLRMERLLGTLREVYSLYGFTPLDTPAIESAEVLLAKGGGETEKQIYRFMKGDSDLALRFDLTVPLAKYVAANYAKLAFPFRRYQIGKVWRGERAQRGRFREFYQADIDVIGDGKLDIMNEAEIPSIICRAFTELGLEDFTIRIHNRKVLGGFFAMHGMNAPAEILRTIDKLEKIGPDKVREILLSDCGLDESQAAAVLSFTGFSGTTAEKLAFLEGMRGKNELFDTGVDELRTVAEALPGLGVPAERFAIDLTIARGLDYYTGTVYETMINSHPEIGSVCSGGRYDNLAEYYTDRKLPGVGLSIGVTRLFYVLGEQGLLNPAVNTAPCDAIVLPMTEDTAFAAHAATVLRDYGIRTQLYTEQKKFKQKLSYAGKLGIPFALIIGEDELESGEVSLKDMNAGTQARYTPEDAALAVLEAVRARGAEKLIKAD